MKRFLRTMAVLLVLPVTPLHAADPYVALQTLRLGQPNPAIVSVQSEIAAADRQHLRAIEEKLIVVLQSPESTADAKSWVCRTLRTAGSAQAVPALSDLLTDTRLASDAQYALRSIQGQEADEALRAALVKTQGLLKAGVIQTLGARRDQRSVPAVAACLSDSDPVVVEASLYALGQIGGEDSLQSLQQAKVASALESYRLHAVVLCAEHLAANGKGKIATAAAREVYMSRANEVVRAGALRTLILADKTAGERLLTEALTAEDNVVRAAASRLLCESAPIPALSNVLSRFDSWVPEVQVSVLSMVTNPLALPVARSSIQNSDQQVRVAACAALGRLGGEPEVSILLEAVLNTEPVKTSARNALAELRGKGVDQELLRAAKATSSPFAVEAIRAMADRSYTPALPTLFELAETESPSSTVALKAIGRLAGPANLNQVLGILINSRSEPHLEAAEAAAVSILPTSSDTETALSLLLSRLPDKPAPVTCALLRLISHIPTQKSLEALRTALASNEPSVKDTAVRCLADWPNKTVSGELLRIASNSTGAHRALALRGVVRLASLPGQSSTEESLQLLSDALKLSSTAEEKRAVLATLTDVKDVKAMQLAISCLKDSAVETEAASAVVTLAKKLQVSDTELAASAIQTVLDTCKTDAARQMAQNAGVVLGNTINIATRGKASSPDDLDKDGQSSGDQAAIDGDISTYWDEQDGAKLYRLLVTFNQPEKIAAISISGYGHHNFAPKDFQVLFDGEVVKTLTNAQYTDNLLVVPIGEKVSKAVQLEITGYYGGSPAIRELGIYQPKSVAKPDYRVLVFSKTLGFRHANIPLGVAAIRQLGAENGFAVDATEDSSAFTPENLARYRTVIFLSATGDILNSDQEKALIEYVLGGGGFAAIHGALFGPSACEDKWEWYHDLCCVSFKNHSAVVPAQVEVEDRANPSTAELPARWTRTDEWYNYDGTPRGKARVLATIDESTYSGGTVGPDHPIAWCKRVGKGIMWYTAMGHTDESFREPLFLKHVLGGIQLTAGVKPANLTPNEKSARP